ncbi:hypothetical protein P2318_30190 [Myxococcaceae bacterium GXIMD 01537]
MSSIKGFSGGSTIQARELPKPVAPKPPPPPPPPPARTTSRDDFRAVTPTSVNIAGGAQPNAPATNLFTENRNDGSVNCLDAAADYLDLLPPQQRGRAEVVFLADTRPGAEGQDGHVLVKQGNRFYDPVSRSWHDSLQSFDPAGNYRQVGTLNAQTAHRILQTPAGSPERAAALQTAGVSPELAGMMVADVGLTSLVSACEGAKGRLAELDAQLARQLEHYGPAMTPEQQQAFVQAFQAEHPEYAQLQQAQAQLEAYLSANYDGLREAALSDPAAARELAAAMQLVAGTPNQASVEHMLEDRELSQALFNAVGEESFRTNLLTPATEKLTADALAAINGETPDPSALDHVGAILSSVGNIPQLADEVQEARSAIGDMSAALRLPTAEARLARLGEIGRDLGSTSLASDSTGGLLRVLKGLNFGLGVLTAAEGIAAGDRDRALQGFLAAGQNVDGLAYGIDLLSKSFGKLAGLAQGIARVAPVLSALANGIDFLVKAGQINSPATATQAFGSLMACAGAVCMLFPPAAVVGAAFTAVGTAAGVLGNLMQGYEVSQTNQAFDAEAQRLLGGMQPPMDSNLIRALAGMDSQAIRALAERGGFSPADFQTVANQFPAFMAAVSEGGAGAVNNYFAGVGTTGVTGVYNLFNRVPVSDPAVWSTFFDRLAGANIQSPQDFANFIAQQWQFGPEAQQRARDTSVPGAAPAPNPYLNFLGELALIYPAR